jgi:hypothetical protein
MKADELAAPEVIRNLFGSFAPALGSPVICDRVDRFADPHYADSLEQILQPSTSFEDARRIAASLYAKDADTFASVIASRCSESDKTSADRFSRALAIVEHLPNYDPLLPWLHGVAQGGLKHVRSKAVKLLCRAYPSRGLIERQLQSDDSRVRANAIEALWFHQTRESTKIFMDALADPSHRVVVNALIGLHHQYDPTASGKLVELLHHPSDLFRAAAVWAFAHLYDDAAIAPLQRMLETERSEIVREKAAKVLAELLYPREWIAWSSSLTLRD